MENGALMMMHAKVADDEWEEAGGCCCCCFGSVWGIQQRHLISGDNDHSYLLEENRQCQDQKQSWVVKRLHKLKEMSELVAGPRWKTLLRKLGAYFNKKKKKTDFKYNSHDYALNFDHGELDHDDDGRVALGFSSRFAPPVRS